LESNEKDGERSGVWGLDKKMLSAGKCAGNLD
jgi:hypothetical protein